jgi:ketosteroid isomerase-like protein
MNQATTGRAITGLGVSDPSELPTAFMDAFNAGDFVAMAALFAPDAVRVMPDGAQVTGARRLNPTRALYASGARLRITLTGCFVTDDTALLITHSAILDGATGRASYGPAIDVARRTEEGLWVYLIDNPGAVGLQRRSADEEPSD